MFARKGFVIPGEVNMPNRRDFFKSVAGATAGMFVGRGFTDAGARSLQATPGKRREVFVGRKRVKVIDVHCHCVVPEVADVVKGTPLASNAGGGGGRGGGGGNNVLGPARLQIMDEQGLDIQALSINGYWWYAADRELARRIVQVQNEGLAKWVAAHPDRFVAFASVALQHPELAAEQLEDGVKKYGLRGAGIGGSVNGEDLSDPKFHPFWAKAEQLGVLIFIHPQGEGAASDLRSRLKGSGGL